MRGFSFRRAGAVLMKEFIQMRRDRLTFGMMIGVPILQLILFGFAINTDPKHMPAATLVIEDGVYARSVLSAMENTGYFRFTHQVRSDAEGAALLARGDVAFVMTIPDGFAGDVLAGRQPQILIEADASDPVAAGNALATLGPLASSALIHDLPPGQASAPPFSFVVHRQFNPEGISAYNIVPGLLGVILTMTMIMITALAVTRETERGTMENLLAMPLTPGEVMLGKILPYIAVGYVQVIVVLTVAKFVFGVPMLGSFVLLSLVLALFIAANLSVGFTISTIAQNQLQALQMTFFFFLPSLLLSGFMFPFRGMPDWAQSIGEVLPLTHFLRIVRGVLLKGAGLADILPHAWPLVALLVVVWAVALRRYRRTLD